MFGERKKKQKEDLKMNTKHLIILYDITLYFFFSKTFFDCFIDKN